VNLGARERGRVAFGDQRGEGGGKENWGDAPGNVPVFKAPEGEKKRGKRESTGPPAFAHPTVPGGERGLGGDFDIEGGGGEGGERPPVLKCLEGEEKGKGAMRSIPRGGGKEKRGNEGRGIGVRRGKKKTGPSLEGKGGKRGGTLLENGADLSGKNGQGGKESENLDLAREKGGKVRPRVSGEKGVGDQKKGTLGAFTGRGERKKNQVPPCWPRGGGGKKGKKRDDAYLLGERGGEKRKQKGGPTRFSPGPGRRGEKRRAKYLGEEKKGVWKAPRGAKRTREKKGEKGRRGTFKLLDKRTGTGSPGPGKGEKGKGCLKVTDGSFLRPTELFDVSSAEKRVHTAGSKGRRPAGFCGGGGGRESASIPPKKKKGGRPPIFLRETYLIGRRGKLERKRTG